MPVSRVPPLQRFHRLSRHRRSLLVRSVALLAVSSAIVAAMPFRRAIRFGSIPLGRPAAELGSIEDSLWAIETAARYLPFRTKCIEKGLAAQRLLRRAGWDSRLHYGARTGAASDSAAGVLAAHVWLSLDGRLILGGDEAPAFAEIARYP